VFGKILETIGAAQRKYMNHQAKKNIVWILSNYICVNVPNYRYQCINYRYIYGSKFFKVYQNHVIVSFVFVFSSILFLPCKSTFMDEYDGM
jgi:hypothetical protein